MIKMLNLKIVGWRNYIGLSTVKVLRKMDNFIRYRLILWYNKKRKRRKLHNYYDLWRLLYSKGLKRLVVFNRKADGRRTSESRMRENLMYGIDEGKLVEITSKPAFYSTITFRST